MDNENGSLSSDHAHLSSVDSNVLENNSEYRDVVALKVASNVDEADLAISCLDEEFQRVLEKYPELASEIVDLAMYEPLPLPQCVSSAKSGSTDT